MTGLERKAVQRVFELLEIVQGDLRDAKEILRQALAQPEHEPVAWMHNFIEGNVITHKPVDIALHPDRWTALYKDLTPCKTCQSLAMAVMTDQIYHEKVCQKREWVGLTGLEQKELMAMNSRYAVFETEAKLKEKNT